MPNTKSAERRSRSNVRKHDRNVSTKSRVKSYERHYLEALKGGDKSVATTALRTYTSVIDKAVKSGVIPKGTASRKKSRLSVKLVALK
jgi:small subunit ribosomal protein S20